MKRSNWTIALTAAALALAFIAPASAGINKGGTEATADTGSIKGVVKFDGEQKSSKPIDMAADAFCAGAHGDKPARKETYVFGDNNTLVNVLVYVDADLKAAVPSTPYVIDQVGCIYTPHVNAVMVGQKVLIRNSDSTMHNVNFKPASGSKNAPFNVAQPLKMDTEKTFKFLEKGASLSCQVHPWMKAYLWVLSHPYYAVTQKDGSFEITGLPPGDYEIKTWHELRVFKPDKTSYKVTVEAGKSATVDVTYSPPKKK